ncbi:MAG: Wzz/FepE/Etk N-terminal domain-containing protein [Anaerolineales bacterium]|nr:Wzz/FepE/Etk N-terminal domain-containing protein [Anaerolineales bacterium]
MELKDYFRVVWRYWWLIAALVVIVGVGSWIFRAQPAPQYQASVRFTIGVNAPAATQVSGYDPILTSYQASEYIRDDFVEIIKSDAFADDVNAVLAKMGASDLKVGKGNIAATIEKQRRLMSLTITWADAAQAQKIADAAVKNLGENNAKYFAQLGASGASVAVIDRPVAYRVGASLREQLDIPIRVLLALLAGIALAFILDYLDTSVRDVRDVEALGLRVLGEIPKPKTR